VVAEADATLSKAWSFVRQHPVTVLGAGVAAAGLGAYALIKKKRNHH
jgi:hypothetical protein